MRALNYDQHQWPICADLKIVSMLIGRCGGGNPTYPCHLCTWKKLRPLKELYRKEKKKVKSKAYRKSYDKPLAQNSQSSSKDNFNIVADALVPADNSIFPPFHLKLGVFRVLYKQLNQQAKDYAKTKFKKKEEVFNGPEIFKLCKDPTFSSKLKKHEKAAFEAFKDVSTFVLTSKVHPTLTNEQLVDTLFKTFKKLDCSVTYIMQLLRSHIDRIPKNADDYSDQHGERYHQKLRLLENRFVSRPSISMLAKYCFDKTEYAYPELTVEQIEEFEPNDYLDLFPPTNETDLPNENAPLTTTIERVVDEDDEPDEMVSKKKYERFRTSDL